MMHTRVVCGLRGLLQRQGNAIVTALAIACALCAAACDKVDTVGPITRSSLDAIEDGKAKMAAGDYSAARALFTTAVSAGGIQPDMYCEARIQQATCAAKLGDFDDALAIVNELSQGAPDIARVDALRKKILSLRDKATATKKDD